MADKELQSLPTKRDFDPWRGNFDALWAWDNFGGLTLDEAKEKFRECPDTYQEDFMFMGGKAFAFYFPVIERHLLETDAYNGFDDRQAWILAHVILMQLKHRSPQVQHLWPRVLALATFVRKHIDLFSRDPDEQQRIIAAWQEVEAYVEESKGRPPLHPQPNRRWLRFSLRTLFMAMTVVGFGARWVAYNWNWAREREAVLKSSKYRAAEGSFFLEPPPVAPWPLRMFGAHSYRWIVLVIVDPKRAKSDDEMHVDLDDERLTSSERDEILRLGRLFPEGSSHAWFRATSPR